MKSTENISANDSNQLCAVAYLNNLEAVKTLLNLHVDIDGTLENTGMSSLYLATIQNNIEIVDELITHNANVNCLNKVGETPLHVAAQLGYVEIMEKLISAGADINALTYAGRLPLFYAHVTKNLKAAAVLLQHGSSLNLSQTWLDAQFLKYLDFYLDFHPGKYEIVYLSLIKKAAKEGLCYGFTKLRRLMSDSGRVQELNEYLEKVSSWDQDVATLKSNIELENIFEKVLFSVFRLHKSDAKFFQKKFNPLFNENVIKDIDYSTYMEVFSIGFIFKINELEILLTMLLNECETVNFGAPNYLSKSMHILSLTKIDSRTYEIFDSNASLGAIKVSSIDELISTLKLICNVDDDIINAEICIEIKQPTLEQIKKYSEIKNTFSSKLISQRVQDNNINLQDKLGSTSLHAATNANDKFMVSKLLENGANIRADKESLTPIYLASQWGNADIIKKLLEHGDKVDATFENDSGLIIATNLGHNEAVKTLIENQATIDFIGRSGSTPLCFACQEGFYEIAEMLINAKADVNFCVSYKNMITGEPRTITPLGIAIQNGHSDIVNLLLKNGATLPTTSSASVALGSVILSQKNDCGDSLDEERMLDNHCQKSLASPAQESSSKNNNVGKFEYAKNACKYGLFAVALTGAIITTGLEVYKRYTH